MNFATRIEIAETGGRTGLAGAIVRDILTERPVAVAPACFACGRSYCRGDRRFCSTRCRAAYDAGFPPYEPQVVSYGMPMTRDGFAIACAGCSKTFSSKGLRCCSVDCERKYRDREQNLATMAEAGIEPSVKRKCACGAVIPKWTPTGKSTSANKLFCSPRCKRKYGERHLGAKPAFGTKEPQNNPIKPGFQIAEQNSLDSRIEPRRTWGPPLSDIEARLTGVSVAGGEGIRDRSTTMRFENA